MSDLNVGAQARLWARIAGFFYLIDAVTGGYAELVVRARLIVRGDAGATTANIVANGDLFRLGFAADLISVLTYVAVVPILYGLLKPVGRNLALLAMSFGMVGNAVFALNLLNYLGAQVYLGNGHALSAIAPDQLRALAFASLRLHAFGYNHAIVFFAVFLILLGWLILRSKFFPRLLGLLLILGGVCNATNSVAAFLAPAFALSLRPYILAPGGIAEMSLCLWLLFVGLNASKWRERAEP